MSIAFTIDNKLLPQAKAFGRGSSRTFLDFASRRNQPLAKVSAVGIAMRTHAGAAHRFFSALTAQQIPIEMALSTEIRVSSLVPDGH